MSITEINKAIELVEDFLTHEIRAYVENLGREHVYCDTTIGEIEKAFLLLRDNYDFFALGEI